MTKYMDSGGLSHFMTKIKTAIAATVTGVKGDAESSYRTGQVNITAANVGALGASDNAVSATKLKTARTINVGNYASGTAQSFDGSANITIPVNSLNTTALVEPSISKSGTKTSLPLVGTLKGNKLALLPADQIIIEKTTDGGTTWVDAGVSNATKANMFLGNTTGGTVNIPLKDGVRNVDCGIRITITAMKYNVPEGTTETGKYAYWNSTYVKSAERYGSLSSLYFWVNTVSDGLSCKCEYAAGSPSLYTNWITVFNKDTTEALQGWSGGDYIAFSNTLFGGGTTQTGNAWNWRFTFFTRNSTGGTALSTSSTNASQQIVRICGYGPNLWTVPNNLAGFDHLYTWDSAKNARFPAGIYPATNNAQGLGDSSYKWAYVHATTFYGNLSGNASGNVLKSGDTMSGTLTLGTNTQGSIGNAGIKVNDVRNATLTNDIIDNAANFYFVISGMPGNKWKSILHVKGWNGSYSAWELAGPAHNSDERTEPLYLRTGSSSNTWGSWRKLLDDSMLSSATNSSAEDVPATPKAVKAAYDLANGASTTAGQALSAATGALAFKVTYSVSGSDVVCAAHVYSAGSEVTSSHADSCFVWSMSLDGGATWTSLGTGKTKTVSAMSTFGGNVKCDFTPAS